MEFYLEGSARSIIMALKILLIICYLDGMIYGYRTIGCVHAKTTNRVRTQVTYFFEKNTSCWSMAQYSTCQIFFFLAE